MKVRYSEFKDDIDVDAFEEAIGFEALERRGDEDVGFCPDLSGLHKNGDTTGKFAINRAKKTHNCWLCGGGSLLSLSMEYFDMGIDEAMHWLFSLTKSTAQSDDSFVEYFTSMFEDIEHRVETLPYFNDRVLSQFDDPNPWFAKRGISKEICEQYHLRSGYGVLRASPIRDGEKVFSDYRGDCSIFPHFWQGRLVGWQSRWLGDRPKWIPKYTNTGDFPKSYTLFNYDEALKSKRVVVVESVPTALFLRSLGISSVATFGSGVQDPQKRLLRCFDQVLLAPDNDAPGTKWERELTKYLSPFVSVQTLPVIGQRDSGDDLGDLVDHSDPLSAIVDLFGKARIPDLDWLS